MVRHYFPQSGNHTINANTNNPPQDPPRPILKHIKKENTAIPKPKSKKCASKSSFKIIRIFHNLLSKLKKLF